MSLWGRCAKIVAEMPDGQMKKYFLKASNYIINFTVSMLPLGRLAPSCVRASSRFVNHGTLRVDMGKVQNEEAYFMLVDFGQVGEQPPDPVEFTACLAELHKKRVHSHMTH
ncbi:hypothetical protein F5882DRAFT_444516 [Hyaloscypha sp. PMI_1271]|nr:hypothetical protein F5882DRAFT_444516 [Hyaloscypha sp. PMI_1271]